MRIDEVQTTDGPVLRSVPSREEFQRSRYRLVAAAVASLLAGAAVSLLELGAGVGYFVIEVIPFLAGVLWAWRFLRIYLKARPTAVVATDHSLSFEQLDGSHREVLDLADVASIRIGPDGFSMPWRWLKGPRQGLVVVRVRTSGRGFPIPPQLASHPVVVELLGHSLAASRSRGHVDLAGPPAKLSELEEMARSSQPAHHGYVPPITIPAAWYTDPSGQAPERWWDGREWTGYTRDVPS